MFKSKQSFIKFKKGYKYQLNEEYVFKISIKVSNPFYSDFLDCDLLGNVVVKKGYAWDGASCAVDTDTFMRGSLIHDVLYQLIREGCIDSKYRLDTDSILNEVLKEDGMSAVRRMWVNKALKYFGTKAADSSSKRKTIVSPK